MKIALNLAYIGLLVLPITAQNETCRQKVCENKAAVPIPNWIISDRNYCNTDLSIIGDKYRKKFRRCCEIENVCYHVCGGVKGRRGVVSYSCDTAFRTCVKARCGKITGDCYKALDEARGDKKLRDFFSNECQNGQNTSCACGNPDTALARRKGAWNDLCLKSKEESTKDKCQKFANKLDFSEKKFVSYKAWNIIRLIYNERNRETKNGNTATE